MIKVLITINGLEREVGVQRHGDYYELHTLDWNEIVRDSLDKFIPDDN